MLDYLHINNWWEFWWLFGTFVAFQIAGLAIASKITK